MPRVKVNDIWLNYEEAGRGEALVFLHGYTGSTQDWVNQFQAFSGRYRTMAVDCRGHGLSEAPAAEEAYSIRIFSEDVFALLQVLGVRRCCLIGHSMGGFQALEFFLNHGELLRGLVLVDTSSGEWEVMPGAEELRAKLDELARGQGLEAAFEYDAAHNPVRIQRFKAHPELKEITRQKVLNTSVDGYVYVARTFRRWGPVTERLPEIHVPVLIVRGEEDAGFVKACDIMKERIPGSELVVVPGSGHNPHEEKPEIFNEAMESFLAGIRWS
jgi:pimeloyl-ACP methyl ester carboxylesterase